MRAGIPAAIRCALDARYSTEQQRAESIEDQFRVCERLAERLGLVAIQRFSDAAISGSARSFAAASRWAPN
jgi:site-specific DNA recombinase